MASTLVVILKIFQDGSYACTWVIHSSPIHHPLTNHICSKGISGSSEPYSRRAPSWFKMTNEELVDLIIKGAKKGLTPSQIGNTLRDQNGVGKVKNVSGTKIIRVLRAQGLAPAIPEDLYCLIKKAVSVRKHLERNRKDKDSKNRLILIESRIHRLARYYKKAGKIPAVWR